MDPPPHPTGHPRMSLSTSSHEFGFGHVSSAPPSPSLMHFDFEEPFPNAPQQDSRPSINQPMAAPTLLRKLARGNLLPIRTTSLTDLSQKTRSPLRSSFTRRSVSALRDRASFMQDESDSEREKDRRGFKSVSRNRSGSSPSSASELTTPPIPPDPEAESSTPGVAKLAPVSHPPGATSQDSMVISDKEEAPPRPLSHSLRPPRLLSLMAESNPAENELQSEAQFQRYLAAYNGLPIGRPKSSRTVSDRGRFPEEAVGDDEDNEDSLSEDDEALSNTAVGSAPSLSIATAHCSNAVVDDIPMPDAYRHSPSCTSSSGMDVDMPPPPSIPIGQPTNISPVPWRQTPPPTAPSSRPNKRKHDDRFDPYGSSAKRRAISPSIAALRESLSHAIPSGTGTGTGSNSSSSSGSVPIPIPRSPAIRSSNSMSVASSPGSLSYTYHHAHMHVHTLSNVSMGFPPGFGSLSRPMSALNSPLSSSPQQRPSALLASPVLRPIPRMAPTNGNGYDRSQKEIDGTGQAVSSLSLS